MDDEKLSYLVTMGFKLEDARAALASTKGDVETAVNLLLNGTSAAWENEGGVTEPDDINEDDMRSLMFSNVVQGGAIECENPFERHRIYRACGLKNIGKTCYFNSIVQTLFNIPEVVDLVIRFRSYNEAAKEDYKNYTFYWEEKTRSMQALNYPSQSKSPLNNPNSGSALSMPPPSPQRSADSTSGTPKHHLDAVPSTLDSLSQQSGKYEVPLHHAALVNLGILSATAPPSKEVEKRLGESLSLVMALRQLFSLMQFSSRRHVSPHAVLAHICDDRGAPLKVGDEEDANEVFLKLNERLSEGLAQGILASPIALTTVAADDSPRSVSRFADPIDVRFNPGKAYLSILGGKAKRIVRTRVSTAEVPCLDPVSPTSRLSLTPGRIEQIGALSKDDQPLSPPALLSLAPSQEGGRFESALFEADEESLVVDTNTISAVNNGTPPLSSSEKKTIFLSPSQQMHQDLLDLGGIKSALPPGAATGFSTPSKSRFSRHAVKNDCSEEPFSQILLSIEHGGLLDAWEIHNFLPLPAASSENDNNKNNNSKNKNSVNSKDNSKSGSVVMGLKGGQPSGGPPSSDPAPSLSPRAVPKADPAETADEALHASRLSEWWLVNPLPVCLTFSLLRVGLDPKTFTAVKNDSHFDIPSVIYADRAMEDKMSVVRSARTKASNIYDEKKKVNAALSQFQYPLTHTSHSASGGNEALSPSVACAATASPNVSTVLQGAADIVMTNLLSQPSKNSDLPLPSCLTNNNANLHDTLKKLGDQVASLLSQMSKAAEEQEASLRRQLQDCIERVDRVYQENLTEFPYDLHGAWLHRGGAGGGHFWSLVKGVDGIWRVFDDSSTKVVPKGLSEVLNLAEGGVQGGPNACVLIYRNSSNANSLLAKRWDLPLCDVLPNGSNIRLILGNHEADDSLIIRNLPVESVWWPNFSAANLPARGELSEVELQDATLVEKSTCQSLSSTAPDSSQPPHAVVDSSTQVAKLWGSRMALWGSYVWANTLAPLRRFLISDNESFHVELKSWVSRRRRSQLEQLVNEVVQSFYNNIQNECHQNEEADTCIANYAKSITTISTERSTSAQNGSIQNKLCSLDLWMNLLKDRSSPWEYTKDKFHGDPRLKSSYGLSIGYFYNMNTDHAVRALLAARRDCMRISIQSCLSVHANQWHTSPVRDGKNISLLDDVTFTPKSPFNEDWKVISSTGEPLSCLEWSSSDFRQLLLQNFRENSALTSLLDDHSLSLVLNNFDTQMKLPVESPELYKRISDYIIGLKFDINAIFVAEKSLEAGEVMTALVILLTALWTRTRKRSQFSKEGMALCFDRHLLGSFGTDMDNGCAFVLPPRDKSDETIRCFSVLIYAIMNGFVLFLSNHETKQTILGKPLVVDHYCKCLPLIRLCNRQVKFPNNFSKSITEYLCKTFDGKEIQKTDEILANNFPRDPNDDMDINFLGILKHYDFDADQIQRMLYSTDNLSQIEIPNENVFVKHKKTVSEFTKTVEKALFLELSSLIQKADSMKTGGASKAR